MLTDDIPDATAGNLGPGSRIAGYRLERQIGQGGMAVVFLAVDERLERRVALKILAPALARDEVFRRRFIGESRAAAAVDDPHIIPVFEAGEADGVLFIAMRYVQGADVRTLIAESGPLPVARVIGIVAAAASSLDAAHAAGLVHRDVKPANLLLDAGPGRPDHVYLSDFGLSKGISSPNQLTATGQFLGTLDYIAPEQIESKPTDGRADQYALACSAFEMLIGEPPFWRDDATAVMYAQLSASPPSVSDRRPGLPPAADTVFFRALAKAPGDRFASCREFAEALRAALTASGYAAPAPTAPVPAVRAPVASAPPGPAPAGLLPAGSGPAGSGPAGSGPAGSGPAGSGPAGSELTQPRQVPEPLQSGRTRPAPPGLFTGPGPARPDGFPPGQVRERRPARRALRLAGAVLVVAALAVGALVAGRLFFAKPSASGSNHAQPPVSAATSCPKARRTPVRPAPWQLLRPLLRKAASHQNVVEGLAFSPDGKTLAIGTFEATYLVSVGSGAVTGTLADPGGSGIQAVAYSCDGKLLAVADDNGTTYLWRVADGVPAARPPATLSDVTGHRMLAVAFSPDGRLLAAGTSGGDTYLWPIGAGGRTGSPFVLVSPGLVSAIQAVAFSPDSRTLVAGAAGGSLYQWDVSGARPPATGHPGKPVVLNAPGQGGSGMQAVAFSPDGRTLAAGAASGSTLLWTAAPAVPGGGFSFARTLADPGAQGTYGTVAVAFSPDGVTLAAGGYDGRTYLWAAAAGSLSGPSLADPAAVPGNVQAAIFSPDGSLLATGDTSGGVYLWRGR